MPLSISYRPISIGLFDFLLYKNHALKAQHPTATSRRKTPQHVFPVAFFPPSSLTILAADFYHRAEVH